MGKDEAPLITPDNQRDRDKVMFDSLRLAITDAQTMIRGYDTKAQVLIAVLTFAVGSLGRAIDDAHLSAVLVTTAIVGVIVAFVCCACVVYPRAPSKRRRPPDDHVASDTYYLPPALVKMKLRDLVDRVRATDWVTELVYELQKLASVRQRKAFWFKWAFVSTAVAVLGLYVMLLTA